MAQRIHYYKNNANKSLKELLFNNFSKYKQWYLDFEKSSIEEFNEPFGLPSVLNFFQQDLDFEAVFESLDKKLIDELTVEFFTYYDYTSSDNDMLDFFGPSMSVWRYEKSNKMVAATNDKVFIELWSFVTEGRSLKDNLPFHDFVNEYKIGFLNRQEYLLLKSKIESHFGDAEAMENNYWTPLEKFAMQSALEKAKSGNGYFWLSNHNPQTTGLELVLQAINELTEDNNELITGIEIRF